MPLINVVFLLLIFFMVVGRLSAGDPFTVVPPKSVSQGPSTADEILVLIGRNGELALNGAVVDEATLLNRLDVLRPTDVRLKTDNGVAALRVVALMDKMKAAGVGTVQLLTVASVEGGL